MALEAFVRVLQSGAYNDPDHHAIQAEVGDCITVAGAWYVDSLINSGLVELYFPLPDPTPIDPAILAKLMSDLESIDLALLNGEEKTETDDWKIVAVDESWEEPETIPEIPEKASTPIAPVEKSPSIFKRKKNGGHQK
jgi:hypothetical protein